MGIFEKLIDTIKTYGRKNRLFLCLFALLCVLGVVFIVVMDHNHSYYSAPIAEILSVSESKDHTEYSVDGQKSEDFYLQKIEAVFLNTKMRGETVYTENIRSESNVYDTRYRVGDEIFLSENDEVWTIDGVKRDVWVAAIIVLFLLALILIGKAKGVFSFISLTVNVALLWVGLNFYVDGVAIIPISIICALIFTVISLLFVGGFKRMTLIAVISTLAGVAASFGISLLVIRGFDFKGLYVEGLEFLIIAPDYRVTFLSQILLGGLGAIMDVSVSITSAMCELKRRDPSISRTALLRSAKEIGADITGTMANVLLFTYLCGALPLLVVIVSNGVSLIDYIFSNCTLEIARFLCGSIGIVLCVPVSGFISAFFLTSGKRKGDNI